MNDRLPRQVQRLIDRRLQRISQSHLTQAAIRTTDATPILPITNQKQHYTEIEKCVAASQVIEEFHPPVDAVPLSHFVSLLILKAAWLLIASVVCSAEWKRQPRLAREQRRRTRAAPKDVQK